MVDEKDEYDAHEEGEYHFSDDQLNYDSEIEMPKETSASVRSSGVSTKDWLITKWTAHRRIIIGVIVFLVLIGVVYKIIIPSSTTLPPTDFTAATPPPVVATAETSPVKRVETPGNQPVQQQPASPPSGPSQPLTSSQTPPQSISGSPQVESVTSQTEPPAAAVPASGPQQPAATYPGQQQSAPVVPATPVVTSTQSPLTSTQSMPPSQVPVMTSTQGTDVPPPPTGSVMPPVNTITSPPAGMEIESKNMTDRLASLEQQNAAMVNLLQTEYAQKLSDYETQNTRTRGKLEELTKRLNRIESTLNQLTQLLQNGAGRSAMMMGPPLESEPAKIMEQKIAYSVQAIIPGRAWLKSESGDTVTVAEGDLLRNYGRVTKIDPYDGIVNIDTGNKVITLSYGMNAE